MTPMEAPEFSPRFETPLAALNHAAQGGAYGLTAVGGTAGAGKSMLAMGTALRAAMRGMFSVYIAAEMTENQINTRFSWLAGCYGLELEDLYRLRTTAGLMVIRLEPRTTWDEFATMVSNALHGEEEALLCLDSMNATLSRMRDDLGYWERYERLAESLLATRVKTEGAFGAFVLSEMNQDGQSKGRRLEYDADLMVHMKQTAVPRVVEVKIHKNRERGDEGLLGEFRISENGIYERMDGGTL